MNEVNFGVEECIHEQKNGAIVADIAPMVEIMVVRAHCVGESKECIPRPGIPAVAFIALNHSVDEPDENSAVVY